MLLSLSNEYEISLSLCQTKGRFRDALQSYAAALRELGSGQAGPGGVPPKRVSYNRVKYANNCTPRVARSVITILTIVIITVYNNTNNNNH